MTTWKRKDVKAKGKKSFKDNFWKCVATALILAVVGGTSGAFAGGGSSGATTKNSFEIARNSDDEVVLTIDAADQDTDTQEADELAEDPASSLEADLESMTEQLDEEIPAAAIAAFVVIMTALFLFILALGIVIDVFLANPLELGCKRFFRRNLDEPASMSNIAFAFDSNYKSICKTMFFRDLYTFLWSLLFIIPGIIKSYEYKMIPYLLSEDPAMTTEQAFEQSKALMKGNKWKAFVLDLSFILWDIVTVLTCGIAGIFWVEPYKASTQAALYEAVRYGTEGKIEAAV